MNLIDRINLYFKGMSDAPFVDQEKIWVEKVGNVKTEADVLNLSEELYKWMQENKESQGEEQEEQSQSGESEDSPEEDSEEGQEQSQDSNAPAQSEEDSDETDDTQEVNVNTLEGGKGADS